MSEPASLDANSLMQGLALKGHVAVVTGGSRGIGRAAVKCFAKLGASVMVNYVRDEKAANGVVAEVEAQNVGAMAVKADVSLKGDAQRLIDATMRKFERVDFLVCNAGIWEGSPIDQMTEEIWNRTMDLNLKGTWAASKRKLSPTNNVSTIQLFNSFGVDRQLPPQIVVVAPDLP